MGLRMRLVVLAFAVFAVLAQGCSTRPRGTGEVFELRSRAETQLELAGRSADRGDPDAALFLLREAAGLAALADDSGLIVRVAVSRGNALLMLGRDGEADSELAAAEDEALLSGRRDLLALVRIHRARRNLGSESGADSARAAIDDVRRETAFLSDPLQVAFAWTVIGLAEGELGRHDLAEAAVRRSLAVHERGTGIELVAFDWFMIASFRSRSGDFDGARLALQTSISLDRRAENSWGIASGWRALGDVESRAGNRDSARAAYVRAAGIFSAMGNARAAEDALSRIADGD